MADHKQGKPFAYKVQAGLIVALILSFLLIMQQQSQLVYQIGILLLIVATLVQIPFGNINPQADTRTSLATFARLFVILIAIFAIGIFIAPYLVEMGR